MKERVIVFGAGGHAKVVIDAILCQGKYDIIGLVDTFKPKDETLVWGYKNIGDFEVLKTYSVDNKVDNFIVAIGDNWVRGEIVKKLTSIIPNCNFINVIHPSALIATHVKMGIGNVVLAGAVINSDAKLGNHCIVNTKASVDHDCQLSDFVSISPGATLAGFVQINTYTAISVGATVIEKISIGSHNLVGAGAVVVKDIINNSEVWLGVPAKRIRTREINEKYLK